MPGDVGHLLVEELVHAAHVVDPHDLQRWLEQAGQPGKPMRDAGFEHDRVAMGAKARPRDVLPEECVVVQERVTGRRSGSFCRRGSGCLANAMTILSIACSYASGALIIATSSESPASPARAARVTPWWQR